MSLYGIPNLSNACRLLKAMSDDNEPRTASELSRWLGIPRTSCLRIAETLRKEGFLRLDDEGYSLGLGLIPLGHRAMESVDVSVLAGPVLERLTQLTGETSHLAQWSNRKSLIVRVCDSEHALRAASRPGTLAHAHCSSTGKVFLAWRFSDRLDEIIPEREREARTSRTLVTTAQLVQELQKIRKRGYAVDNEEYHPGLRCLAAPVWMGNGQVTAALGITGVASRLPLRALPGIAETVRNAAHQLSLSLGWKPPA